ncbi:acetyltransferase (GNAT) family protein [Novosphingobium sp. PhB165]|uniref:GNAT family N-acetyltransferase n=1 Tax=Novosphingobium sp. PhB165 TaxID=2485105 RepID=UPI001050A9A1|nr:GNAT family N-acetyltransferase [Novosphingobium sp. PhB165]TCM16564.1 acetyltransferase (GNAT) family protein [Novosphingobium sp. PhB165]
MEIRLAQPNEYKTIAAIWYESASLMDGGAPALDDPRTLLDRISIENGWCLNVAVVDGHIVGLLATIPEQGILDQLFVAPDAQRQGIGAALLDEAKRQLATGFTLRTPVTNAAGHRFYERHGLRVVEDTAHPITGAAVRCFGWKQ